MILDTSSIHEGHSTIRQSSALESIRENLPSFSETVECCAEVDRTGATIYVKIHFDALFEQQCARCLKSFHYPISGEVQLILQEHEGRHGWAGEDETVDFYFNSRYSYVDTSNAIYDEIMISLPLKPLCSDTCQGIILDDNRLKSTHPNTEYDPRWDALKKIQK